MTDKLRLFRDTLAKRTEELHFRYMDADGVTESREAYARYAAVDDVLSALDEALNAADGS